MSEPTTALLAVAAERLRPWLREVEAAGWTADLTATMDQNGTWMTLRLKVGNERAEREETA